MTIARIITMLMAIKIPKGPEYKQVEELLQGMQTARACLRVVEAEDQMLIGL